MPPMPESAADQQAASSADLEVEPVPVTELLDMRAPYNPRTITEHDFEALRRSLRFFGPVEPIVCNRRSGRIVGGHQRVKAAVAEGIEQLPVTYVDLDEPSEKLLNLALNRINGQWEDNALSEVIASLTDFGADLELSGFSKAELALITDGWDGTGIDGLAGGRGHTEGLTPRIVVECPQEDLEQVKQLVTEAVSGMAGVTVK